MCNIMITEDLPSKTKSSSISNDTLCHAGFGCSITRVEKCTKMQGREAHPSITANCKAFFFRRNGAQKRAYKPTKETESGV